MHKLCAYLARIEYFSARKPDRAKQLRTRVKGQRRVDASFSLFDSPYRIVPSSFRLSFRRNRYRMLRSNRADLSRQISITLITRHGGRRASGARSAAPTNKNKFEISARTCTYTLVGFRPGG